MLIFSRSASSRRRPVGHAQLLRRRLQRLGHDRAVIQRPRPPRTRASHQPGHALATGNDPASPAPWSPSSRPAPRSGCSPPPPPPATRSAPASPPRRRTVDATSTAPVPRDHQDAAPMQGQDDSPCLMISDREPSSNLRHAPLGSTRGASTHRRPLTALMTPRLVPGAASSSAQDVLQQCSNEATGIRGARDADDMLRGYLNWCRTTADQLKAHVGNARKWG